MDGSGRKASPEYSGPNEVESCHHRAAGKSRFGRQELIVRILKVKEL